MPHSHLVTQSIGEESLPRVNVASCPCGGQCHHFKTTSAKASRMKSSLLVGDDPQRVGTGAQCTCGTRLSCDHQPTHCTLEVPLNMSAA